MEVLTELTKMTIGSFYNKFRNQYSQIFSSETIARKSVCIEIFYHLKQIIPFILLIIKPLNI